MGREEGSQKTKTEASSWAHVCKEERRNLPEQPFTSATGGLVSGINKGTHSHEDLSWLIAVVYVSNYQVSYVIILYP